MALLVFIDYSLLSMYRFHFVSILRFTYIHSTVDGHLGYFQFGAISSSTAINILILAIG